MSPNCPMFAKKYPVSELIITIRDRYVTNVTFIVMYRMKKLKALGILKH